MRPKPVCPDLLRRLLSEQDASSSGNGSEFAEAAGLTLRSRTITGLKCISLGVPEAPSPVVALPIRIFDRVAI